MANSEVVNEYPAPPLFYTSFTEDYAIPDPPPVPTGDYQVYGGTVAATPLADIASFAQFHKEMKLHLRTLLNKSVRFGTDADRREPIDRGISEIEVTINEIYETIGRYRAHEARESICVQLRQEVESLRQVKTELEETLATAQRDLCP